MTEEAGSDNGSQKLSNSERKAIISRIHSMLFWVGKFIPQHEIIEGRDVDLRDLTFQYVSNEHPSQEDIQGAKELADILEKKARELENQLQEHEVSRANAYQMLDEICGLLRAVDDLRNSHGDMAVYKKKALMTKVNDERRWLQFIDELKLK
jgi:hypothetical protein